MKHLKQTDSVRIKSKTPFHKKKIPLKLSHNVLPQLQLSQISSLLKLEI